MDVVGSPCGVTEQAQAYVFNATVVPQGGLGYLTLWPDGEQPAGGLDAERLGWGDHLEHGDCAGGQTNGKVDAYAYPVNRMTRTM